MNKIKQSILAIVIGLALAAGVSFAAGIWTPPCDNPTGCNTDAPINVGTAKQDFIGSKTLGFPSGVGILTIFGGLAIKDGSQGSNKVLTSDAGGNATWKELSGGIETAQGFRTESGNRAGSIIIIKGPSSAFAAVDNASAFSGSVWVDTKYDGRLDGIKCNDSAGWLLTGCWVAYQGAGDSDIVAYPNGCITNDYRQEGKADMNISCIRNL